MVIVVTYFDKRLQKTIVSHGVEVETGKVVIMSPHTPKECGATWDQQLGEWVLNDDDAGN